MRRFLSIVVMLALATPFALPAFATVRADAHACCRRGAHHCHATAPSDAPKIGTLMTCCHCTQNSPAPTCQAGTSQLSTSDLQVAFTSGETEIPVPSHRAITATGRAPPA